MLSRTAKSCGPDAPTLALSLAEACRPNRARTFLNPRDDGGKRARSQGRARHKPLKPLRRECRVFRWTCGFYPCAFYIAQGAAGAAGTRRSLRPLFWAKIKCTARAHRVASAKPYVDLL